MHLTKSEQQIMEIFWQADHAMAQTEVVKTYVDRKWKERSIFSMLNSLMEKGVHCRAAARKAAARADRGPDAEGGNDPCHPEGNACRPA